MSGLLVSKMDIPRAALSARQRRIVASFTFGGFKLSSRASGVAQEQQSIRARLDRSRSVL